MEFTQGTEMDSNELAENMIAFVLVDNDILRELQDGKDPTDYLIRNLQPSVVPLLRPVQSFSTAPTLQSYSYVPGIFSDDCTAAATINGHYPQTSNFTFTNYSENSIRTHLTHAHNYTSSRPLPVPVPVALSLDKPRKAIPKPKVKAEEPPNSHSGRDNYFPPMWVMVDDEPFAPWVDSDRNNRSGVGTGCDKLKLTKLPCCNEYASEMTCISSKVVPQRPSSVSTDMEFDQQDGRFQNQLLKTCEGHTHRPTPMPLQHYVNGYLILNMACHRYSADLTHDIIYGQSMVYQINITAFPNFPLKKYEEIQNQLKAICFSKPEMLTSTATLAYINTSKSMGTFDDLLRRCCNFQNNDVTASGTATLDLDKENEALPNKCSLPPQQRKSRGRKPLKQAWGTNYIPRSPLPFEKVFDLSSLSTPSSSVSCYDQEFDRNRKVLHDDVISCESESGWTVGSASTMSSDSVSSGSGTGSVTYASDSCHFNVVKKKKRNLNFGSRVGLNNVSKGKGKGPITSSFKTIGTGTTGLGFSYSNNNNYFKANVTNNFKKPKTKFSRKNEKMRIGIDTRITGVSTISELTTFPEEIESSTNNVATKNAGSTTTTALPALISTPKQESPFEWLDTYFSYNNSKNEFESWDLCSAV